MNESPETDDDRSIRGLLAESGTRESPELLEGLRVLRSFRALPPPEPTGELAALLAKPAAQPRQRSQRHRGLILSFALAGAMAAGTTGVAANNDLRLATEAFCADVLEQVLPQGGGEQPLPEQPPASAEEPPVSADDPAAGAEGEYAAAPEDPDVSAAGDVPAEYEGPAGVEAPSPAAAPGEAPGSVPGAEAEQVVPAGPPEESAQEAGRGGGHTIRARPHPDNAAGHSGSPGSPGSPGRPGNSAQPGNSANPSQPGRPGNSAQPGNSGYPGAPGHAGAPGHGGARSGPGNSGHPKPASTNSRGSTDEQLPTR